MCLKCEELIEYIQMPDGTIEGYEWDCVCEEYCGISICEGITFLEENFRAFEEN